MLVDSLAAVIGFGTDRDDHEDHPLYVSPDYRSWWGLCKALIEREGTRSRFDRRPGRGSSGLEPFKRGC